MRRTDNTIVFGSDTPAGLETPRMPRMYTAPPPLDVRDVPPSMRFPDEQPRRLADDLVEDNPSYIRRPARGLAFVVVSLALVGIAAAGTYFLYGTHGTRPTARATVVPSVVEPASTTTVTRAEIPPPEPLPTTSAAPAAPAATPSDQPWNPPVVDAVKAPTAVENAPPRQVAPVPRKQPVAAAPAPPVRKWMPKAKAKTVDDSTKNAIDRANFPHADTTAETPKDTTESSPSNEETTGSAPTQPTPAPSTSDTSTEQPAPSSSTPQNSPPPELQQFDLKQ